MGVQPDAVAAGGDDVHLLILAVGERVVAFPIARILEIIRMVAISPLPDAPEWIPGVINLRGTLVPVVDLRKRFEIKAEPYGLETPIAIFESSGRLVGVIADAAVEIAAAPEESITAPDELVGEEHPLVAVMRLDGAPVPILDVDRVCAGTELLKLPEIDELAA
jgi:purine-binding chemotaxis protein CheW